MINYISGEAKMKAANLELNKKNDPPGKTRRVYLLSQSPYSDFTNRGRKMRFYKAECSAESSALKSPVAVLMTQPALPEPAVLGPASKRMVLRPLKGFTGTFCR